MLTLAAIIREGLSHVHTRILSATAPMNLALNYLLGEVFSHGLTGLPKLNGLSRHVHITVNGPIPALRLGFAGAPLCTVLSHNALAIMLIIYIAQRALREEVQYLRGLNTVTDEPVPENANSSGRPTSGDRPEVTFFTGLGTLIFEGVSGVLKSASQLWSKDFGGGESALRPLTLFLMISQWLRACMMISVPAVI